MADFLEWDATRYGLAVPEMDAEHAGIVGLMNRLHELQQAGADARLLAAALAALAELAARHFRNEEAYMARLGHGGLASHRRIHQRMLAQIADFQRELAASGELPHGLFTFLKEWLTAHICGVDAQYARRHPA